MWGRTNSNRLTSDKCPRGKYSKSNILGRTRQKLKHEDLQVSRIIVSCIIMLSFFVCVRVCVCKNRRFMVHRFMLVRMLACFALCLLDLFSKIIIIIRLSKCYVMLWLLESSIQFLYISLADIVSFIKPPRWTHSTCSIGVAANGRLRPYSQLSRPLAAPALPWRKCVDESFRIYTSLVVWDRNRAAPVP